MDEKEIDAFAQGFSKMFVQGLLATQHTIRIPFFRMTIGWNRYTVQCHGARPIKVTEIRINRW